MVTHRTLSSPDVTEAAQLVKVPTSESVVLVPPRESWPTGKELLQFAGTWDGDDAEELLEEVIALRGETEF